MSPSAVPQRSAREVLRAANARQRLLYELSQRLRDTRSDRETIAVVTELLARYFGALRVGYCEVEPDGLHAQIEQDWCAPGAESIAGRHRLSRYGPQFEAEYRAGRSVAVGDFRTDPRTAGRPEQQVHAAVGVRAQIVAPVLRQGRLLALLFVHSATPRRWSEPDRDLVAETAEWTWWVIENARAVRQLRESERRAEGHLARLDLALSAAQQGVFEWNVRTGAVQLDARSREIFGFGPGEGQTQQELFERVHPADRRRVRRLVAQGMAPGTRTHKECRLLLPGGVVRYLASIVLMIAGEDGRPQRAIGVFADVTERRWQDLQQSALGRLRERTRDLEHAQDVMRVAAEILAASLGAARAGLGVVDLKARRLHVDVERAARGHQLVAGEHDIGTDAARFEPLHHGAELVLTGVPGAPGTTPASPVLKALHSGSLLCVPVTVQGDIASFLFVAHEVPYDWSHRECAFTRELADRLRAVLKRTEAERALRESAEREGYLVRLLDLLRSLEDAQAMQAQASRLLGEQLGADRVLYCERPPDEADGADVLSVVQAWYRDGMPAPAGAPTFPDVCRLAAQLRTADPLVVPDMAQAAEMDAAQRASFEAHAIRSHLIVPLLRSGRVVACLAVLQAMPRQWTPLDIWLAEQTVLRVKGSVKRARAEAALREAHRRKDEFLATLAHELRNPLAPVRNGLQILRLAPPGSLPTQRAIETMERQVAHIVRLIDDLLDVSRITRGKMALRPESVSLDSAIHSAVEAIRPLIDANQLSLDVHGPQQPLWLFADPTRLVQIISNLLKNAADYTPAGGHVELRANREGDEAVVRVIDDGIGIAPEMLPRIFDFFTQAGRRADRSQGGLGIGLSISRRVAQLHGGTLEAASEGAGKGSVFTLRLPLAQATAQAQGAAPAS